MSKINPVQPTSLLAYQSIILSLGERQKAVLKALKEIQPANNRMLSDYMKLPINSVVPRVYECRMKGLIKESHIGMDNVTKKQTIFWITHLK